MKTVVVGASPKPHRYSNKAIRSLLNYNHEVVALGLRSDVAAGVEILDINQKPLIKEVDTITVYVSAERLLGYEDYLISLNPSRFIFNPGAENPSLENKAKARGIEVDNACTLVMLGAGVY